jgi:hypothetical protein
MGFRHLRSIGALAPHANPQILSTALFGPLTLHVLDTYGHNRVLQIIYLKTKDIPETGRGGPKGCEMFWIPHCLDNRLTDGGKVVSPTHRTRSTPEKHYFSVSGTHFC